MCIEEQLLLQNGTEQKSLQKNLSSFRNSYRCRAYLCRHSARIHSNRFNLSKHYRVSAYADHFFVGSHGHSSIHPE